MFVSVPKADAIFMKVNFKIWIHSIVLPTLEIKGLSRFSFLNQVLSRYFLVPQNHVSLVYVNDLWYHLHIQWICHDWSDDHCLKFLKNCYEALPDNGKVIVAECILPVAPDSSLATKGVVHGDVIMLAHHPGGKERTEEEFEALAKGSGFQGFLVLCCAFNTYVMEFLKKV